MRLKEILQIYKKGIFRDFILNILASLILTIATQLIAYPYLSRILSGDEYGLILTVMGIANAVGVSLGNPLNNTRILLQPEYDKKNLNGDYNPLFSACLIVNVFVIAILTTVVLQKFDFTVIGCVVISILILFRSYYSASYRIIINYKKNLYSNVFGFVGYIFGVIITSYTKVWVFTFIFGELFSCIYIYFTAKIVHDNFQLTSLFKKSARKYIIIMSAAILSTMMMYMDRFFIYPLLGAEQVSIYTVASYLGKTAGIVMTPIAGVLLSYYAKEAKLTIKQFYKRTGLFTVVALLFYLMTLLVGVPITRILYPTLLDSALQYFAIANLAATIAVLGNTIQPTLLRFCKAKWQPIIQGVYFVLYLLLGYIGMKQNGLMGFCFSVLTVNTLKIFLMLCITTVSLYKNEKKGVNNYVEN